MESDRASGSQILIPLSGSSKYNTCVLQPHLGACFLTFAESLVALRRLLNTVVTYFCVSCPCLLTAVESLASLRESLCSEVLLYMYVLYNNLE